VAVPGEHAARRAGQRPGQYTDPQQQGDQRK
jgi:hypothetical protein